MTLEWTEEDEQNFERARIAKEYADLIECWQHQHDIEYRRGNYRVANGVVCAIRRNNNREPNGDWINEI